MQSTFLRSPQSRLPVLRIAVLLLTLLLPAALACRIIIPPPWPPRPWPPPEPVRPVQPMEVRSHKAVIDINRNVAKVSIEAVFHNPNSFRVEGTYLFPIGRKAVVSSFTMTVDGKTLEAELLEADKARQIYEDIVRRMKDPALLEYLDQGLLKARVFPIEPNKDVKVTLAYEEPVTREGLLSRFTYPLLSVKPDAGGAVKKLTVEVNVRTASGTKSLFCPGFETAVKKREGNVASLSFEASDYTPDKDFQIIFSESAKKIGVDFLAYKRGEEGYFMMVIAPDSELQKTEIAAKDVTFVLDTSGSMMGSKIDQAKQALLFCIDSLNKDDNFNLITFSTDVVPFSKEPIRATSGNREKAREFISSVKAMGGTAIDDALAAALTAKTDPARVSMIVFLTDGLPTVGEVDPEKILSRIEGKKGQRIFTFGVGYDVNARLLDGTAAKSGGYSSYVRPGENLELALSSFYEKIAFPVMTELKLETGDVELREMNPRTLPDLFRGAQLVVTGRCKGAGKASMKLSGTISGTRENFLFEADLEGDAQNAFVPRQWAINQVGYLQEQLRLHGQNQELINEIKRLGRQYGILTPYTSFLIVEQGIERDHVDVVRREFDRYEKAAAADAGPMAVEAARMSGAMQHGAGEARGGFSGMYGGRELIASTGLTEGEVARLVIRAYDKTFYRRAADGFWYDAEIPTEETPKTDIEVEAYSTEFFKLLAQYPVLKKYMLAGSKLVIRLDGKIIRITEAGTAKG